MRAPRAALVSLSLSGTVLAAFSLPLLRAPFGDTFFQLSVPARAGLVLVSAAFLAGVFWLLALKTAALRRWVVPQAPAGRVALALFDVGLGWAVYVVLHHASPQFYYLYYLLVFPDLPMQWVLGGEIDQDRLLAVVALGAKQRLSDLLAATGFWAILPFTLLLHRPPPAPAGPRR